MEIPKSPREGNRRCYFKMLDQKSNLIVGVEEKEGGRQLRVTLRHDVHLDVLGKARGIVAFEACQLGIKDHLG